MVEVPDLAREILLWPPVLQVAIFPGFLGALLLVMFVIWFERKAAARVQMRYGPLNISPRLAGLIQVMADLTRYALQEIILPKSVDKAYFLMGPVLYTVLSILPIAALPVTPLEEYHPIPMDYSLLVAMALTTLPGIFILLAGWASNNKFAVVGSMREAYLITAYEIPIFISALAVAIAVGTFNLVETSAAQSGWKLFLLLNPLAAMAFFISVLMSTSRFPFEIPEAENEIVAGPYTEYSALLYGLNMGGSYIRGYVYSVLFVLLFLGGWHPVTPGEGIVSGFLIPALVVFVKASVLVSIMAFLRAIFPRYRIDQALEYAWKYLVPLALAGLFVGVVEAQLLG